MAGFPSEAVEHVVDAALAEDCGRGDPTSRLTVEADQIGRAAALAKSEIVVAGLPVFRAVFVRVDPSVAVHFAAADGERAAPGSILARVDGPARSILAAERVALNLLQRLSGVATLTRRYVDAVPPGCTTRILDTRKTTPGLRALERYAVRQGGGLNHRPDLAGGILIKDNHIAACGGQVAEAVRRALRGAGPTQRVEVEVTSLEQLAQAIDAGAHAVLLDNMPPDRVAAAVRQVAGRVPIEVSGGIKVSDVPAFARAGVDFISVGALTHSAPAADISLELEI
jgi:nicotinate-nucleotide pyrophosphorylase (carboxylating)